MTAITDHLLRTLASVPTQHRVLDLSCGTGEHAALIARLGFDVYACAASERDVARARAQVAAVLDDDEAPRRVTRARPEALGFPDAYFDWVVARGSLDDASSEAVLHERLAEARRVLKPGGWLYVVVPAVPEPGALDAEASAFAADSGPAFAFTPSTLDALLEAVAFAVAEDAVVEADLGRVRGIYRRVDAGTPV